MFIKKAVFKKLVKEAYATKGLYMHNDGEGLRLKGAYWDMWIQKLPKEYKSILIELVGDLPEVHSSGSYTKEGIQEEIPGFECSREAAEQEGEMFQDTGMIIINDRREVLRVLQSDAGRIMTPYNHLIEAISNAQINSDDGESTAEGAFNPDGLKLTFRNNVMTYMIFSRHEGQENVRKCLENLNVYRMIHPDAES